MKVTLSKYAGLGDQRYQVDDKVVLVTVIAVGKRDKGFVYLAASARLKE